MILFPLRLWRYLSEQDSRKFLARLDQFTIDYDLLELTSDERLLMQAGLARDPLAARMLLETQSIEDMDLKRGMPDVDRGYRLKHWLLRLFGETETDRTLSEYRRDRERAAYGIYETPLSIYRSKK